MEAGLLECDAWWRRFFTNSRRPNCDVRTGDGQRFFRVGKCFLNCSRRLHVHAIYAGFARQFEQSCRTRILCVQAVTKAARRCLIERDRFARGAIGDCFQLTRAIWSRPIKARRSNKASPRLDLGFMK
jgi:hypothetical protein